MWDGGNEAIETMSKESKKKKLEPSCGTSVIMATAASSWVCSAGFNSWRGFSGCAHCANLNKGPYLSVQSGSVFSAAYHLFDRHMHAEQAAVFTLGTTSCYNWCNVIELFNTWINYNMEAKHKYVALKWSVTPVSEVEC